MFARSIVKSGEASDGDATNRQLYTEMPHDLRAAGSKERLLFTHASIVNAGPDEVHFAVNDDATTAANTIILAAGEEFDNALIGTTLNYTVPSGSAVFRYSLER